MKKHILGLAIFSFIFASFAAVFAYFYAPPIPHVAEVKQPVYQSEPQSSCRKKDKKSNDLQYEVISSQYFYGQNKVVSEIKLIWKGYGEPPKKLNIVSKFGTSTDLSKSKSYHPQFFSRLDTNSNSGVFKVINEIGTERFDRNKNLYAHFTIFDENSETDNPKSFISTHLAPVVFVHGGSSFGYGSGTGQGISRK